MNSSRKKPGAQFTDPLPASLVQGGAAGQGADEYAGQGGSYVFDPNTGRRQLVERTIERGEGAAQKLKE